MLLKILVNATDNNNNLLHIHNCNKVPTTKANNIDGQKYNLNKIIVTLHEY